jgi:hypothetical protein
MFAVDFAQEEEIMAAGLSEQSSFACSPQRGCVRNELRTNFFLFNCGIGVKWFRYEENTQGQRTMQSIVHADKNAKNLDNGSETL